jgi:hypothetical protein
MTTLPKRIQWKRTKGWRMPENAVYVGRPTEWANQFIVGHDGTAETCVALYRRYFVGPSIQVHGDGWLASLRGKDLACWCRLDQPCHADVLLELANAPRAQP